MSYYTVAKGQFYKAPTNNDELYHYGVLGMKWGVHRARNKIAKQQYKAKTDKAFRDYERSINSIEKGYKRGQTLSKKDQAREAAVEKKYSNAVSKAKKDYKNAKKDRSNDAAIANRLYSKQSKETNERITSMSTGKAVLQSYLMGSYGALKYNEAKSRGASTGKAVVEGLLYNTADNMSGGVLSTGKYLKNRFARKK